MVKAKIVRILLLIASTVYALGEIARVLRRGMYDKGDFRG
jgi:hypothetical protein